MRSIGGESAGAAAVLYHMFSNGGNPDGLFHAGVSLIFKSVKSLKLT